MKRARAWFASARGIAANLLALGCVAAWLAWHAYPSTEAVRLRNALLFEAGTQGDFDWTPHAYPRDFILESASPSAPFRTAVLGLALAPSMGNWDKALALAAHLGAAARDGGPIQSDLATTYREIVQHGRGYCADFVRAFLALAHAAGVPARQWAFSFDGFGGHGHTFVEVYDEASGKWLFLDVFNNLHALDRRSGRPLSALELRAALLHEAADFSFVPNGAGRPGFPIEARAIDYFRRGAPEWYMWWGNAVFDRDASALVQGAQRISHELGQLAAVATGRFPSLRALATEHNRAQVERMLDLRTALYAMLWLAAVLTLLLPAQVGIAFARLRTRSARPRPDGPPASGSTTRLLLVGPVAPPAGGMANQLAQLADLLRREGFGVQVVAVNPPYRPRWIERVKGVRAGLRLAPYLAALWTRVGRADIVHVLANSGWAWYLFAAPAVATARLRRVPVVVHYHGGGAAGFFAKAGRPARAILACADSVIVPSDYLRQVFACVGIGARVIPNVVDLERFAFRARRRGDTPAHVIVTRNLEPIYDIGTAIRAYALAKTRLGALRLSVAGAGPELEALQRLAAELGVACAVQFTGRLDGAALAQLYRSADLMLNPSRADNAPVSILEAFASGVPVVSTDVGGIPHVAEHMRTAWLVPPGDPAAMAEAIVAVLSDHGLARSLAEAAAANAARHAWPSVRRLWLEEYARLSRERAPRQAALAP